MPREADTGGNPGPAAAVGRRVMRLAMIALLLALPAWAADGGAWVPFGPEGAFVPRRGAWGGVGTSTSRADGGVVTVTHGSAQCAVLSWRGRATDSALPLSLGDSRGTVDLLLRRDRERWRLYTLTVHGRRPGHEVSAGCSVDVTLGEDAGVLETNLGPVFHDGAACTTLARKGLARTCAGGQCTDAEGHARLFDLGPCEAGVTKALATLSAVETVEASKRLATLDRLRKVVARGGVLHERRDRLDACVRWTVRPDGELRAKLRAQTVTATERLDEAQSVRFLPLEGQALVSERSSTTVALDGGALGTSGSGTGAPQPLLFGDGAFVLGGEWYFFDRAACERR